MKSHLKYSDSTVNSKKVAAILSLINLGKQLDFSQIILGKGSDMILKFESSAWIKSNGFYSNIN